MQNLLKYADRLKLDKDVLVLQRALKNEILKWSPEEGDWQLPMIIEHITTLKLPRICLQPRDTLLVTNLMKQPSQVQLELMVFNYNAISDIVC